MSKREELESQKDMEEKEEFKANVFRAIDGFNQPYFFAQKSGTKPIPLHDVRLRLNDDMARRREPEAVIFEDEKVRIEHADDHHDVDGKTPQEHFGGFV